MRVRWTKRAEHRLYERTEYIRESHPDVAKKVITAIRNVTDNLGHFPYSYHTHNEFQDFREAVVPRYPFVVWYRIKEKEQMVEIMTVWHTSQDRDQDI